MSQEAISTNGPIEHQKAISWDMDGVLARRIPFQSGAVKRIFFRTPLDLALPEIPIIERTIAAPHHSIKERWDFLRHSMPINLTVARVVPELAQTYDQYVNSGRRGNKDWDAKAKRDLEKAGVLPYIKGIYFKPEGIKGTLSKAAAIRELLEKYGPGNVTHVDDNAEEVVKLAKLYPDVNFVILQDLSTGLLISMKELKEFPNVSRVAKIKDAFANSRDNPIASTRNSPFRRVQDVFAPPIANFLYENNITADQVTEFGLYTTKAGAEIAARRDPKNPAQFKDHSKLAFALMGFGQLADAVDGPVYRLTQKRHPELPDDSEKGSILDALADREGELDMATARIITADKLGNRIGKTLAWIAGITNTLPSWAKANAEKNGVVVPENGPFPFGVMGTRVTRSVSGVISTGYPKIELLHLSNKHESVNRVISAFNNLPHQQIFDAAVGISNLVTARQRLKMAKENKPTLDEKTISNSKAREQALRLFALRAFVKATITYFANHKKKS